VTDGEPHVERVLRRQVVELEGREETNGALWDPLGRDGEGMVRGHLVVGPPVEAASDPHEVAAIHEAGEGLPGNALVFHLTGAENPSFVGQRKKPVGVRAGHRS